MDKGNPLLSRLCLLPCHTVLLLSIWCMLEPRGHVTVLPLLPLILSLSALLVVDLLLLDKEVKLPVFVAVNTVAAAACTFFLQRALVLSAGSVATHLIFSAMVLILFTDSAITAIRNPKRTELLATFDLSIVLEAVLIALSGTELMKEHSQFIVWGFVSCISVLAVLTVMRVRRSGGEDRKKPVAGYAVLLGVLLALCLTAYLSLRDLESVSASLVNLITRALTAIGAFLRRIIDAFYEWLLSLFGESYVYDFDPNAYSQRVGSEIFREYRDMRWLIPVVFSVLIAVAVMIIIRHRKKRLGNKRRRDSSDRDIRTTTRTRRFARLRRTLADRISFWIRYLKNRNSPAGRFIRLERKLRRHGIRRKKSETPHAFLRRLSPSFPEEHFEVLADELELIFYSAGA